MEHVYVIISEESDGKFISVYSSLEKAKILLQNKTGGSGKYVLVKSIIDNIPLKLNNDFKLISLDDI